MAGKYRLIDIPLSNCINSGLNRIYVLTQFNSVSLHRHIRSTYTFDPFDGGFVEMLAAQQTLDNATWYQGTADAVRQNLRYVEQPGIEYVLILSGDQLYRMNFQDMIVSHIQAAADVTIAAVPVHGEAAASAWASCGWTKPAAWWASWRSRRRRRNWNTFAPTPPGSTPAASPAGGRDCLANMGIYLFNRNTLVDLLRKTDYHDFGKEVFPASIRTRHVQVHLFDGYWEDIGTIKLVLPGEPGVGRPDAAVRSGLGRGADLHRMPAFCRPRASTGPRSAAAWWPTAPSSSRGRSSKTASSACAAASAATCHPQHGPDGGRLLRIAGRHHGPCANGDPPLGIGDGSHIEGAIIDKNCRIGRNVRIINEQGLENTEETPFGMIRDGIVVTAKGTSLPDGWRL